MNLVIVASNKLYFDSLHARVSCTTNKHNEINFCYTFYFFIQLWGCMGEVFDCSIGLVSSLVFCIGQSLFSMLQLLEHPVNLSVGMVVRAISISFFSFWKLNYFSEMTCSKNLSVTWFHALPQSSFPHQIFLYDIRARYWLRISSWNISSIPNGQIPTKGFQACVYVCYIIWECHCPKLILARLRKLTVL